VIEGYDDGFETTAPVGSFPPNALGLHDLCGNVHEWVADNYSPISTSGVLRGGGWNTYQPQNLYPGARNTQPPDFRDSIYGFRVVLAKVPPKPETETPDPEQDG
jgi:formylglycine-generating enzyme required for sulfatase activity